VYRPLAQRWDGGQTLFVRTSGDPAAAARIVQDAVSSIDPLVPRLAVTTLAREATTALLPQRVAAMVTGVLGLGGLALAVIGLYGLISYGVALRLREIGVRLALGASRADVVRMVLAQGLQLTALGVSLGLVASVLATRFVKSYLLSLNTMDPIAFTGAAAVLSIVTVLAAVVPARRAGAADPLVALRID
jgi:ABC-type antimicrobial peptide transport system permease subunit